MRDPELVARAQRAATRLESAWEQWRALHGLAVAPGQPVVSYVGYSLKEPWGEPRVVIGIGADEAEYLAEFLDRDECAQRGQVPLQQVPLQASSSQASALQTSPLGASPLPQGPAQHGSVQHGLGQHGSAQRGSAQLGSAQLGSLQQVALPEATSEGTGDYPSSALLGAPVSFGIGRQSPDQVRDIAAELAGWTSGELPGQVAEQLAAWPPGASDQPPA
jgi:hypothetical protein